MSLLPMHCLQLRHLLPALAVLCAVAGRAQTTAIDSTLDHEVLIERLQNAKDLLYREALWNYTAYLAEHPSDVRIQVERCAFIGKAMYDAYEEYNPNEEAHDSCLSALGEAFPDEPLVQLARADHAWGTDRIELLSTAEASIEADPARWSITDRATVYRELASAHHIEEDLEQAYAYMERLCLISPDDLGSLLRARILVDRDEQDAAREALNLRTDTSEGLWALQQRASLLLELDDHSNALRVYRVVEELDSSAISLGELARTLEGAGQQALARLYFTKDTVGTWGAEQAALALFEHDLRFHGADTCLASYNAFRDHGYAQDPLALSRLQLFMHHPLLSWKARDLLGLLSILLLAVVLFLVPYLWVLPVHFIGHRWPRLNGRAFGAMHWGLKDLWWVSAAFLLASLFSLLVCPACARSYFQEDWTIEALTTDQEGSVILAFVLSCAALTLLVLFRTGLGVFRSPQWDIGRTLGTTLGFFIGFRFLAGIYLRVATELFGVDGSSLLGMLEGPAGMAKSEVLAFVTTYGAGLSLLVLAALVPLYEEVVFRGVVLNSITRHLGFGWANTIQAMLFSAVHGDLFLAPYFFGFGLVAGVLTKRSESLLAGILFHMVNNAFAVGLLIARQG